MSKIVNLVQKLFVLFLVLFSSAFSFAQQDTLAENKQINIVYGGTFTKDEARAPGASIFSMDDRQVQFEHQGADLWCDYAIFYQKENRLKAVGNIRLQQGDSVQMTSGKVDYDGNTKLAKAWQNVILEQNPGMRLETDTLRFDREKQEAYYKDFGTVIDSTNTLTSQIGRYYMETKKYQFLDSVHIDNPEYKVDSKQLDYYTSSKNAYMYGPSTVTGKTYKIYCERGFYDTKIESGYGIKNTRIDYNNRIIVGDSVYFNKAKEYASATNNIVITDTVNNGIIRAHYAEVFKAKDSVFATKRAVAISLVEKDSLYIHGDTLMITGKPDKRIMRAFKNAKFYKTDLSGKADSIHVEEATGLTQLIGKKIPKDVKEISWPKYYPVIWNGENQMTGDSIHLISDLKTEKLDSLKVIKNAFIVSSDTIGKTGYNQAKGIDLYGKFIENTLDEVDLIGNTEVVYWMYNDDQELIGINKTICSKINITFNENEVEDLTFYVDPDGSIFPEKDLEEELRILKGMVWRGDERIMTKEDIFDEDDNNVKLVVIQGIENPIDIDAEEEQRSKNSSDPVNNLPTNTTISTTKKKSASKAALKKSN
ncbi:OstA-like protein [Cellulophaga sp. L1A9]|uniref:OstA-like protein n=1 Tax=Cellulophaga sp. L1A9 TaxID=2686362 RepID=UPI00131CA632|nr:OstA-like protein [Cellulophaga sp. L1A9]